MANYTTNTSDKKKKTALAFWAIGALGVLGLENFYVGKIKNGLLHTFFGLLVIMSMVALAGNEALIPMSIVLWAIAALPNLLKLLLGVFKDNVGSPIRR